MKRLFAFSMVFFTAIAVIVSLSMSVGAAAAELVGHWLFDETSGNGCLCEKFAYCEDI